MVKLKRKRHDYNASHLLERIERGVCDKYFNKLLEKDNRDLIRALDTDDYDEMRRILIKNISKKYSDFEGAINDAYDDELAVLSERLVEREEIDYFKIFTVDETSELQGYIGVEAQDEVVDFLGKRLKKKYENYKETLIKEPDKAMSLAKKLIKLYKIRVPAPPPKVPAPPPLKKIEIKYLRKGKEIKYERTITPRWSQTPRQEKFIKARLEKTGSIVYKEFVEKFGKIRTESAVKTKLYRLRRR